MNQDAVLKVLFAQKAELSSVARRDLAAVAACVMVKLVNKNQLLKTPEKEEE
ncbi:MAG: hypothetical protein AAF383_14990 [Cyanobacteria bacterium P01_A01_bin.83]